MPGSLRFLPVHILELPTAVSGSPYWLLESLLTGSYTRFSNNMGYINEAQEAELAHAFSHWTHSVSEGRLMVTDLQGTRRGNAYTLTDAAIHCPLDMMRFGACNQGAVGIDAFFETHRCASVCAALGLQHQITADMIDSAQDSYYWSTGGSETTGRDARPAQLDVIKE